MHTTANNSESCPTFRETLLGGGSVWLIEDESSLAIWNWHIECSEISVENPASVLPHDLLNGSA